METELPYLSVVIPAYNEEQHIAATVTTLDRYLAQGGAPYEIIVVDDGSQDGTWRTASRLCDGNLPLVLLRNPANCGKGRAVRQGMLAARGAYVFFMDADLSYPVEGIAALLAYLQDGYDLAIGSRALPESQMRVRPPLRRHLAGRLYSLLIQAILMRGIPDTQCGFKGFRRAAAHDLFARATLDDFAFDVEVLFLARKLNYAIKAVPVQLTFAGNTSKVRLLADSWAMFLDLFRIRANNARGTYGEERAAQPNPARAA